ncbi:MULTISPECIES: LacI family DNA-binding transcriptional regulator [unclassified Rhizobium]|uniref:LacI family DNA-binding transcriptional regulator n=1 Tax=unclassified Rhizobium TaxID=2613769 RepID=UPI001ADB8B1A|nr:LacI family DNA-binding transcriptional regulator [Rhizobium sp. 16-488-2b]MBO9174339.1 LacI family DNA-binding transcriptional regulator [Rhizobium sp. 16-488-2a]
MKNPTLIEVAKMAGVSTATVNRVLKSNGYVSDEARRKVEEVVRLTSYQPNIVARGLRTSRSYTIGFIVSSITVNPFFVNVARGFEAAALREGYSTIIVNHGGDAEREANAVHSFRQRQVDAIVFNHASGPEAVQLALAANIPVVEIERATTSDAPFVRVDNYVGARDAMRHLIALGHSRIAFLGGDPALFWPDPGRGRSVEDDRLAAYTDALTEARLPVDPAMIKLGRYNNEPPLASSAEGYEHGRRLLLLPQRPTAIFATCDILAAGVLQSLYEAGLSVPRDVSVVGFDDTLAANLTPPLTTVAQPMTELGEAGFALALAGIEGRATDRSLLLQTSVVERASTSKFPA